MVRVLTAMVTVAVVAGAAAANPYGTGLRARGLASETGVARKKHGGGGGGCDAKVGNHVYRCTVVPEGGAAFTDCLRFTAPGALSDKFDLATDQLGAALGCTCKATGSPKRPKFGGAPAFVCAGDDDLAFEGTAVRGGKAIGKGFAGNSAGTGFVFTCQQDPACTVGP
jgi:hypothetical protein